MRKSLVALLLAVGAAATTTNLAMAYQEVQSDPGAKLLSPHALTSRAHKLGTSAEPDTTYIGFTPGHSANNWWSVYAGNNNLSTPWHRPPAKGGMWDFEPPYADVHGDSLQGWWPLRTNFTGSVAGIHDYDIPARSGDWGNGANYIIYQAAPNKRTYGVVGVWHVDGGNTVVPPAATNWTGETDGGVKWAPLAGTKSAWMGVRRHGDNSVIDPITNNPVNEDVFRSTWFTPAASGGTDKQFPGYGSAMDQMLYRDIDVSALGANKQLTVSFQYSSFMDTRGGTTNQTRTGWFQHDPLVVATGGGNPNYISNIFGASTFFAGPADSFMVYVGSPAESAAVLSDGTTKKIFDPQRRWFDEVLNWSPAAANNGDYYSEILTVAGHTGVENNGVGNVIVPSSVITNVLTRAKAKYAVGKVRLVFRVKTNRNFDDELANAQTSHTGGKGAVVLDNVVVQDAASNSLLNSQFENASDIDNNTGVLATAAWKSTGKPPQAYFHVHQLSPYPGGNLNLAYQDLCGQVGDAHRTCDMQGQILSHGDHDNAEQSGQAPHTMDSEPWNGLSSPTINLSVSNGVTNNMGLVGGNAGLDPVGTKDVYAEFEIYTGDLDFFNTGEGYQFGAESYPSATSATGAGEHKRWGDKRYPTFLEFQPYNFCVGELGGLKSNGCVKTTNVSGVPDSIRIIFRMLHQAYRFNIPFTQNTDGVYFDNISLAIVDGAPVALAADIWDLFQDTFPSNDTAIAGNPASFDTTTALIKIGRNVSQSTNNANRFTVPGDSAAVIAEGDSARIDLVFRILPGPGNYVNAAAGKNSQLRAASNSTAPIPTPALSVNNFWANYMFNNGTFGTPGGHPTASSGPLAGQKIWNPNVWNSARCDTAEAIEFNLQGRAVILPPDNFHFQTTYHETELADVHRGALGISRNLCFVTDSSGDVNSVICGSGAVPAGVTYPPAWVTANTSRTGYNGSTTTKENTKIIPDGLLTPGSHVEYFFRRKDGNLNAFFLMPDTAQVFPQDGESNFDAHRWQEFSVLPDRWKDGAYTHPVLGIPGAGPACMLYLDWHDRNGDERVWVGVADSIGATRPVKYGAHNGWHASGAAGTDINTSDNWVAVHGGQPGTTWDMYGIKASESLNTGLSFANRGGASALSRSDPTNSQMDPKTSRSGPSEAMLNTYYKILLMQTGDLASGQFGPFTNKSSKDFKILEDFLLSGDTNVPNRGIFAEGEGMAECMDPNIGDGVDDGTYLTNFMGLALRDPNYRNLSGNSNDTADLSVQPRIVGNGSKVDVLGLDNHCTLIEDVFDQSPALAAETQVGAYDEPVGVNAPYIMSIVKNWSAAHPWIIVFDGWDPRRLQSREQATSFGRLAFYYNVFAHVFNAICDVQGAPGITLDVPQANDGRLFMSLRNNPLRSGAASVDFGLPRADRVKIQIFDVSGRLVRTLADRTFAAGEHKLAWDGADDRGRQVNRGVYFVRSQHADTRFTAQSKLIVLK